MTDIGIIDTNGGYRVITLNATESQIPLKPIHEWDGEAWSLVDEPDNLLGIINSDGQYREISYGSDEQVVELRPTEDHQWIDDEWVFVEPPRDIDAEVAAHALALKVGIVNATRVDGLTDPATAEGLAAIEARYKRITDEFNTASNLGKTIPQERIDVVELIYDGHEFFQLVDAAAATIIAAGDAADPIHTDTRWPAIPNAE